VPSASVFRNVGVVCSIQGGRQLMSIFSPILPATLVVSSARICLPQLPSSAEAGALPPT